MRVRIVKSRQAGRPWAAARQCTRKSAIPASLNGPGTQAVTLASTGIPWHPPTGIGFRPGGNPMPAGGKRQGPAPLAKATPGISQRCANRPDRPDHPVIRR
jgi:hypothetical protein